VVAYSVDIGLLDHLYLSFLSISTARTTDNC